MEQINKKSNPEILTIFYDGNCALCHGLIKFVLKFKTRDRFRFSPIQGETYSALFGKITTEPNTVIVTTPSGDILDRSTAIAAVLVHMGGLNRILGRLIMIFPKTFRDRFYRCVSSIRYRIFGRTKSLCPIIPAELSELFLP